nr:hypothetical protein Iba_chr10eCG0420 [Ipomoea batatas]
MQSCRSQPEPKTGKADSSVKGLISTLQLYPLSLCLIQPTLEHTYSARESGIRCPQQGQHGIAAELPVNLDNIKIRYVRLRGRGRKFRRPLLLSSIALPWRRAGNTELGLVAVGPKTFMDITGCHDRLAWLVVDRQS